MFSRHEGSPALRRAVRVRRHLCAARRAGGSAHGLAEAQPHGRRSAGTCLRLAGEWGSAGRRSAPPAARSPRPPQAPASAGSPRAEEGRGRGRPGPLRRRPWAFWRRTCGERPPGREVPYVRAGAEGGELGPWPRGSRSAGRSWRGAAPQRGAREGGASEDGLRSPALPRPPRRLSPGWMPPGSRPIPILIHLRLLLLPGGAGRRAEGVVREQRSGPRRGAAEGGSPRRHQAARGRLGARPLPSTPLAPAALRLPPPGPPRLAPLHKCRPGLRGCGTARGPARPGPARPGLSAVLKG